MGKSALELVEEANAMLNVISVEEAQSLIGHSDVVFVDVRDPDSVAETGIIPGGVNAPRGLLEFYADPEFEAFHKPELDPEKHIVVTCGLGGQAALSGKVLKEMGFKHELAKATLLQTDGNVKDAVKAMVAAERDKAL